MFADTAGKLPHTEPRTGQNRRRRSKRSKEDNEQGSSAESCGSGDTRLNDSSSDESGAPRETSQRDQIWDSEDDEVNNEQNQNAAEDATRECDDEIYILLPPAQKTFIERQLSLLKGGKRNGPKPAELRIKPPNPLSRHFLREVTPDDFCVTALNIWDPETTFGLPKPACPHCMCKDKVKRRKWSRPRPFLCRDHVEWFVGRWYACGACKKTFRNYVPEVLRQLPFYAQRCFPAVLTHKSGISIGLMEDMRLSMAHRMSVRGFTEKIQELHRRQYRAPTHQLDLTILHLRCSFVHPPSSLRSLSIPLSLAHTLSLSRMFAECRVPSAECAVIRKGSYYSLVKSRKGTNYFVVNEERKIVTKVGGDPQQFPAFGSFGGKKLSPGYLGSHIVADFVRRKRLLMSRVMMVTGEVLSGDMSFKVAKHVCVGNVKYGATWSVMNEFGELLGVYFCRTKSLHEVVPAHTLVQKRYVRATDVDARGPKVFYSDQPISDEAILTSVHPSLEARGAKYAPVGGGTEDHSILKLPNKPIYVKSAEECDRVCAEFERNGMLGFDMEWNKLPSPGRQRPPGPNKGDGKVATIQLATELQAAVIHLPALGDVVPDSLRRLLENPDIAKVGVHSTRDASRLLWDFGVNASNVLATEELAKDVLSLQRSGWGLKALCDRILGKSLPKEVTDHTQWEMVDLPATELQYAALDAHASLAVHAELESMKLGAGGGLGSSDGPTTAAGALLDEDNSDEDELDEHDELFGDNASLEDEDDALHNDDDQSAPFDLPRGASGLMLNEGEEPDRRVKNDAFHILKLYSRSLASLSRSEPVLGVFMNLMMNAMFLLDANDQKEVVCRFSDLLALVRPFGSLLPAPVSLPVVCGRWSHCIG